MVSSSPKMLVLGIGVGLVSSFVQSLALTIQRKSHLQNEARTPEERKPDYRRPLWIASFLVYILANISGTVFQIGALPIVVLGPLGACSLLYNALFAGVILGDNFSLKLLSGTVLIAGGAALIGVFGIVPEESHTLEELVRLYCRAQFIAWIALLCIVLAFAIVCAHTVEFALERRLLREEEARKGHELASQRSPEHLLWRRPSRRMSDLPPVSPAKPDQQPLLESRPSRYGAVESPPVSKDSSHRLTSPVVIERVRLLLGIVFGSVSGTLSGVCLLFAKTGIELLVLSFSGDNQFRDPRAWAIVVPLIVAALLQLFYLNHALKFLAPTLTCPLAFCFYNLSSIVSGLIYYNQWSLMSALQGSMVTLGTAVLLAGVWVVSVREDPVRGTVAEDQVEVTDPLALESDDEDEGQPVMFKPHGFSVGLSSTSPGFAVRPRHRAFTTSFEHRPELAPASESDEQSPRRRLRRREFSIGGSIYVGRLHGSGPPSPVSGVQSRAPVSPRP